MEFPVDVFVSGRHEDLESSAQSYMNKLLYSNPDHTQYLTLPSARKIQIGPANVGFVPLYGANLIHKVLALFAPEDQFTAVALFLADQWYTVEDVLRTSDPSREGLVKVRSVGERIVLYVLNRIIYRTGEMALTEVPFLCHAEDDYAKILWKNGEAVGFHSVKSKGSLCNSFVSQCYLLPVMDSIFVRKDHRGNGHGLQMLEDFVDSFKDDELGLKYPLTQAMQRICSRYLSTYPADVDLLWEVEGVGGPYQKAKVANRLASLALRCNQSSWVADDNKNGEVVVNEVKMKEESCLDITEEVVAVNKHLKVAGEIVDLPVSTRTRSSGHKPKKRLREEPDESAGENPPEKINRSAKEETEMQPDAVEPDAVVPEAKDAADVETEREGEEETNSVQDDQIMAEPENPVNGELSDSLAEKEEGSTDTPEAQECSLKAKHVNHNGTAEEEMVEPEGESESQEAPVEKEDVIDNPEQSEEQTAELDIVSEGIQETVEEEHEEEKASSAVKVKPEEELAPAVEEEQQKDVPSAVEEEPEEVPHALEEELEQDVTSAVEEEPEEEVAPVVEEAQEKVAANDLVQLQEVLEASYETPVLLADMEEGEGEGECVCSVQDSETLEGPSSSQLDNSVEEASSAPVEGEDEEKDIMETEELTVSQNETANCELLVESQCEETKKEETNDKDEQNEEENTTATTTEDEKEEDKSSEETSDSPDVRVLRGGRSKSVPPTPKRTSSRLSKAVIIEEVEEELEEEEEEKLTSAEEEKGSTEEDEAPENNSEEEEEPPVIDMRVLRRKTKLIKSMPRPKAKRRTKI